MYNNSSKLYKKAKELNITDYVEDSYQNHQSLQQTLINEYGKENGLKLLEDLVSAC